MKKHLLFAGICLAFAMAAHAQQSKVVSAYNYLTMNPPQLDKARENIDAAALHPDSKEKPKTWFYRGNIYLATFDEGLNAQPAKVVGAFLDSADRSYTKANSFPKKDYRQEISELSMPMAQRFAIVASNEFSEKHDYNRALYASERALSYNPTDTFSLQVASLCAYNLEKYDLAVKYFEKREQVKAADESTYQLWERSLLYQKDTTNAFVVLDKGLNKYKGSRILRTDEINLYIVTHRLKEAGDRIEKIITLQPKSGLYKYLAGYIAEKQNDTAKAIKYYEQSIADSNNYFDPQYSLGALYFNKGAEMVSKAKNIPVNRQRDYEILMAKSREELKKALPFMEAAYAINGKDKDTVRSLYNIYEKLGNAAKAKQYQDELKKLN